MMIALRCRCGKLRGQVESRRVAARLVCYCKDCQAYGRFLGTGVLDAAGGTEVAAMPPSAVRFEAGLEHLACMSLGPRGTLRWYASCCRTPVGNTPRNPRVSYVGLPRACMDAPAEVLDREMGPLRARVNTESATAKMETTPASTGWAVCRLAAMLLKARLGGGYKDNPFFAPQGTPVRTPQVLSLEERKALTPG
ncbi:DUF6151 family protein [Massilia consociata]|uniref:DUF6151 family protein n=1 Tax=Massilia consociata TaxID=760117 RepID=A0ABV6FBC0_9BURK